MAQQVPQMALEISQQMTRVPWAALQRGLHTAALQVAVVMTQQLTLALQVVLHMAVMSVIPKVDQQVNLPMQELTGLMVMTEKVVPAIPPNQHEALEESIPQLVLPSPRQSPEQCPAEWVHLL